jgi:hypothetical protein
MNRRLLFAVLIAGLSQGASGDEPAPPAKLQLCAVLENRIVGPRTADRPLPLLQGDPVHGSLRTACTVPWSTLSPDNRALPVTGCYRDSMLQIANAAACGRGTGPLWVSSRWVLTSAELQHAQIEGAHCQKMETTAYAGTRDFPPSCLPENPQLKGDHDARPASRATATDPSASSAPPSTQAPK